MHAHDKSSVLSLGAFPASAQSVLAAIASIICAISCFPLSTSSFSSYTRFGDATAGVGLLGPCSPVLPLVLLPMLGSVSYVMCHDLNQICTALYHNSFTRQCNTSAHNRNRPSGAALPLPAGNIHYSVCVQHLLRLCTSHAHAGQHHLHNNTPPLSLATCPVGASC